MHDASPYISHLLCTTATVLFDLYKLRSSSLRNFLRPYITSLLGPGIYLSIVFSVSSAFLLLEYERPSSKPENVLL